MPHSTMLGVAVFKNVSPWFKVPEDDVPFCKNVDEVDEMVRWKTDSGDAGSRGEASLKSLIVSRATSGEKKGLCGDCGDVGEFIAVGEKGGRVERGEFDEGAEAFKHGGFGGTRRRGLKSEIGAIACSDDNVMLSVWEYQDDVAEICDTAESCCVEAPVMILSSKLAEGVVGKVADNGEGVSGSHNDSARTGGAFLSRLRGTVAPLGVDRCRSRHSDVVGVVGMDSESALRRARGVLSTDTAGELLVV